NRLSRGYNKHIIHQEFDVGGLVLEENPKNTIKDREKKGKFKANVLGPYVVIAKYGSGAYKLAYSDGEELPEPMTVMNLKR
ncbi:hypothetical protein KI387_032143, partial [Taxus chinensis]